MKSSVSLPCGGSKRPPPGGTVQWNVTGGGSGADGPKPLDADGKVVRDLEVSAKAFPQGTKTCNVAIDVATGPWKTLAATVGANPGSSGDGKHGFAFSPTFAAGDKIILTVSHNVLEQRHARCRRGPRRQDDRGRGEPGRRRWQVRANHGHIQRQGAQKMCRISSKFSVRPYARFEIRDVSLVPGERTWPRVVKLDVEQNKRDRTAEALRQRLELLEKVDRPAIPQPTVDPR